MAVRAPLVTRGLSSQTPPSKTKITIMYGGLVGDDSADPIESFEISWFKGTRDATIERHIVSTLGLQFPEDERAFVVLRDISDGMVVPISDNIPNGSRFRVAVVRHPSKAQKPEQNASAPCSPQLAVVAPKAARRIELEDESSCLRMPLLASGPRWMKRCGDEEVRSVTPQNAQMKRSARLHMSIRGSPRSGAAKRDNAGRARARSHSSHSRAHSHFATPKTPVLQNVSRGHIMKSMSRTAEVNKTGQVFFARLTKFERLSTHLANERTWLAWVRTICSTLTPAFALLTLVGSKEGTTRVYVTIASSLAFIAAPVAYSIAWHRYQQVKGILNLPKMELHDEFRRVGIRNHAAYLLFTIGVIAGAFIAVIMADYYK